jgi:hypothetical protein
MTRPFRFDHAWVLPIPPADLWAVLARTDRYPAWWSWLRDFDAEGLVPGTTARCTIRSPLRYSLRCAIHLDDVEPYAHIATTVAGDLRGPARLDLRPDPAGSAVRLRWSVTLAGGQLAAVAMVARPAMVWAHDQVIGLGFEQFLRRALDGRPADDR